jgi:uncharacterized ferredoxin-like protein
LGWCIILISSKFEVSSSLGLIRCSASPVRKADGMILIGLELEVLSSFSFIRRNATSIRKADGIPFLS